MQFRGISLPKTRPTIRPLLQPAVEDYAMPNCSMGRKPISALWGYHGAMTAMNWEINGYHGNKAEKYEFINIWGYHLALMGMVDGGMVDGPHGN